jgi:hypothetical protein
MRGFLLLIEQILERSGEHGPFWLYLCLLFWHVCDAGNARALKPSNVLGLARLY